MRAPRLTHLTVAALIAACALVVLLTRRLTSLGQAYQELRQLTSLPHTGYTVPAVHTVSVTGDSVVLGASPDSNARQVIFVLTTTCPYCKAALPYWARLADSASRLGSGVKVYGVSLDSVPASAAYAVAHHLRYPLVTFPERKLVQLFRARAVPQTLVLDHEGRVLYARTGPLDPPAVLDSIYRAITWRPTPPLVPVASLARPATGLGQSPR